MARKKAADVLSADQIDALSDYAVLSALETEVSLDAARFSAYLQRINRLQSDLYTRASQILNAKDRTNEVKGTGIHF